MGEESIKIMGIRAIFAENMGWRHKLKTEHDNQRSVVVIEELPLAAIR